MNVLVAHPGRRRLAGAFRLVAELDRYEHPGPGTAFEEDRRRDAVLPARGLSSAANHLPASLPRTSSRWFGWSGRCFDRVRDPAVLGGSAPVSSAWTACRSRQAGITDHRHVESELRFRRTSSMTRLSSLDGSFLAARDPERTHARRLERPLRAARRDLLAPRRGAPGEGRRAARARAALPPAARVPPLRLAEPSWVVDPSFDVADHVTALAGETSRSRWSSSAG